jgi:hypothetical protein
MELYENMRIGIGKRGSPSIWQYYPSICLERLRKNMNLNHPIFFSGVYHEQF